MPTLRVAIELDNDAFCDSAALECARLLRKIARTMGDVGSGFGPYDLLEMFGDPNALRDSNGNTVGTYRVTVA